MEELMDNELINTSAIETIDSREVAEMVGIQHKDLLKKVRNYEGILAGAKLRPLDFFIPSEYQDAQGKPRDCYLLTKKGCEMVANKLTGESTLLNMLIVLLKWNKKSNFQKLIEKSCS